MTYLTKVDKAKKLIKKFVKKYDRICVAHSFGKDSMVLLHLVYQIEPDISVIAILADTEFPETFELRDQVVKEWKLNYKEYNFKNDPSRGLEDCCRSLKVEKFKEAFKDIDCWFSGIRKDEGITRTDFQEIEEKDGLVKVNPILYFTEKDIWRYTALNNIPFNKKYNEGYRSLSCQLCSAKETDENELERAGRWKGTSVEGAECGIHSVSLRK